MRQGWRLRLGASVIALVLAAGCGKRDRITDPGDPNENPGGIPAAEASALQGVFAATVPAVDLGNEAVEVVAEFVFAASVLNQNQLTTTGTLTRTSSGDQYQSTPGDHLVVVIPQQGAPNVTLNIVITAFEGDFSGDASDFANFHSNLAFRVQRDGQFDLSITSQSGAPPGAAGPATNLIYQRHLTGTRTFEGVTFTADLTLQGTNFFEISGDFAELDRTDAVSGSLSGAGFNATIGETTRGHILTNAGEGTTVSNNFRNGNDSVTVNGVTYGFSQIAIQTELTNGKISEPDFWNAAGTLTRNGTAIGALRFASPPAGGGNHPGLVFDLGGGGVLPL